MERGAASSHSYATPLARLPLSLVRSIFSFAVDDNDAVTATNRHSLAQVSREWYDYVWGMECAEELRAFSIDRAMMTRAMGSSHELLALRNGLTMRRACLRELDIETDEVMAVSTDVWRTLFATVPQLETLSIRSTAAVGMVGSVVPVLRAAARHCSKVRSLTLPTIPDTEAASASELVLTTLLDSLARWKHSGGGLRELTVTMPFMKLDDPARKAIQFVEAVARNCPSLALVGDLDVSIFKLRMYERSHGQWHIDLDTWETFCASCTQLTAFDWSVVPFTTAFFDVFGKYVKPQLTSLALGTPSDWNWEAYHCHYPVVTATGYDATARHAQTVLAACPALRRLLVIYPVHNDDSSVATTDLFGDAFCETLATCCPMLERFELEPASHATLVMFTDRAMRALARLSRLTDISLAVVNITGDGLLALFVGSVDRRTWRRQRNYSISVGDGSASAHAQQFYTVAIQFLTLLAEWKDLQDDEEDADGVVPSSLPGASERVLLQLSNLDDGQALESSREYVVTLKELTTTVLERHPQLRLRVVLQNPSFDDVAEVVDFSTIEELALYTQNTVLPTDERWTIDSDRVLDNVFVVRGGDDQSMDEDDEDDDGGDYFYDDPYDAYDSDSFNGDPADYYDDYYDDDMDVDADYDPESLYPF